MRECVDFLEPIQPCPSKNQFDDISQRLCDRYPSLKDLRKTVYWVSYIIIYKLDIKIIIIMAFQITLKDQITQRYRNNRRRTPASKSNKISLPNAACGESKIISAKNDDETEEYNENVTALRKLVKSKHPAVQTIQDLLKATRKLRVKWLNLSCAPLSIHGIYSRSIQYFKHQNG